ncbi:cytochrome b/b6 domain-containing protein [Myceligenerans xiligouense]|uniref:Cytochrome b561-like protein n=1 Tax=Myceligenerans xiligouense TaxID=253184 RepID=A0A3N4YKS7_9MICO|nr:cytochrome b/b6 domain-containing protein [Myceligenerans xiligouense]RPF19914.1 cytochrome b561-like protein [Myceligenerans xiligouense]
MATFSRSLRQGLPRRPGGPAWPPAGEATAAPAGADGAAAEEAAEPALAAAAPAAPASSPAPVSSAAPASPAAGAAPAPAPAPAQAPVGGVEVTLRRGLPRVAGGEPWPPAGVVRLDHSSAPAVTPSAGPPAAVGETTDVGGPADVGEGVATTAADSPVAVEAPAAPVPASAEDTPAASGPAGPTVESVAEQVTLRRGLPRVAGGEPWPTAETATVRRRLPVASEAAPAPAATEPSRAEPADGGSPAPEPPRATSTPSAPADQGGSTPAPLPPAAVEPAREALTEPVPSEPAVAEPAITAPAPAEPAPTEPVRRAASVREPRRIGSRTLGEWARTLGWRLAAVVAAAGIVVLAARGVTTLPGVPGFLERYPGSYDLPASAPVGFPVWANWAHYLNFFFLVLIVRTGLLVRYQKTPPASWTPARGGKKISIYLWLHTGIDLLWLANGVVFVVLLFVSGHWMRIVPTSWEVFPNAASAALQYLTLNWPTEHGWVNYNSLQQLMYFVVVFVAAPLAAITGLRMSEWWPKDAGRLNRLFPAPVARAVHFPTMLFFVLFVIAHVTLVFTTGALRNLNHMFAATDAVSWEGFAWFAGGLVVAVAALAAARPLVIAPIASLFGKVSSR